MTKETYVKLTQPLRESPAKVKLVNIMNRILTGIVYVTYPLFLIMLLLQKNSWLAKAIIVPLDSFLIVSAIRYFINAPRPYEKFEIPPVLKKNTKGKSFPSRHVFAVFVIAMTVFYQNPMTGILLGVIGIGIAFIRVVGGVHEPRDVIAGAVTGIFCGWLGYYIL